MRLSVVRLFAPAEDDAGAELFGRSSREDVGREGSRAQDDDRGDDPNDDGEIYARAAEQRREQKTRNNRRETRKTLKGEQQKCNFTTLETTTCTTTTTTTTTTLVLNYSLRPNQFAAHDSFDVLGFSRNVRPTFTSGFGDD